MIKADDFTARVNYAAKCITKMSIGGRAFFSCFEMSDGDAVVVALYRRSLKNPKLAANLWKALCQSSGERAVAEWAHVPARHLAYGARAAREGNGAEFLALMAGAHMLSCQSCGRWFTDESPELVADMIDAHRGIAHKPARLAA